MLHITKYEWFIMLNDNIGQSDILSHLFFYLRLILFPDNKDGLEYVKYVYFGLIIFMCINEYVGA